MASAQAPPDGATAPVSLSWQAPPGCPSAPLVSERIRRLLDQHTQPEETVGATAVVQRNEGGGYFVQIETTQGEVRGSRQLDAPSCEALAKATALILAMMVDPEAVARNRPTIDEPSATPLSDTGLRATQPSPMPAPKPALIVQPLPVVPRETTASEPDPPLDLAVGALGLVDLGMLPRAALGIGGTVALGAEAYRVELRAGYWPAQQTDLASVPGVGGEFTLFALSLFVCRTLVGESPSLGLCTGMAGGFVRGAGYGVSQPDHASPFWLALPVGGLLHWPVFEPVALTATAKVAVPLRRAVYRIEPFGEVHQSAVVTAGASIGLEVELW